MIPVGVKVLVLIIKIRESPLLVNIGTIFMINSQIKKIVISALC